MTATPVWSAAHAGVLGNAGAAAASAQPDQLLGTHPDTIVYQGTQVLAANGIYGYPWYFSLGDLDLDQPFTLNGTTTGRVVLPLLPVGAAADLLVSLCADSSGAPGAVIAQTRIPASWIGQLAAVARTPGSGASAAPRLTGNPLALGQYNAFFTSAFATVPWPAPAASAGGAPAGNPASTYSGNFFIQCGGTDALGALVADVFTAEFVGGQTLNQPVPQPAMPTPNGSSAALTVTNNPSDAANAIVVAGGGSPVTAAVYTASFAPVTGAITSWSSQTPLPQGVYNCAGVSWNDFVYVVGGVDGTGTIILNTVYYAAVANGQISAWGATTLPVPLHRTLTCSCNGFLFVIGGIGTGGTVATVHYALLDPGSGAPGPWQTGPPLPAASATVAGDNCMATPYGIAVKSSGALYFLGVSAAGPATSWLSQYAGSWADTALFPAGTGTWQWFQSSSADYQTSTVNLTPMISVPLPASGLTGGATYHVRLQQQGGDLNDYLRTHIDLYALPGDPSVLTGVRGSAAWGGGGTGNAIPMQVFDGTAGGQPQHTWEDAGARITTLAYATAGDRRLLGVLEATRVSVGLNSNQGFETGTAPWTATNCTLTQSTARSFAGIHSGQVVPNGSVASTYIQSEQLPCSPGMSVTVSGQVWFTSAVTSNFSLSATWYTAGGAPISNSSTFVSVPGAAWTVVGGTYTAPAGACSLTLTPNLIGTPPSSNVWWIDNAVGYGTYTGPQQSTVTALEYSGTVLTGSTVLQ